MYASADVCVHGFICTFAFSIYTSIAMLDVLKTLNTEPCLPLESAEHGVLKVFAQLIQVVH